MIATKVMFDLLFHFGDILIDDLRRKWHWKLWYSLSILNSHRVFHDLLKNYYS